MDNLLQFTGVSLLDQPKTLSLPDTIRANSSSFPGKDTGKRTLLSAYKRYLPILTFDLVSVTLVLFTCYEFTRAKLLKGIFGSEAFFSTNIDKVILYASLVFMILTLFLYSGLYIHHVIQTRAKQFFYIVKSFFYADIFIIVTAFFFLSSTLTETFREFIIIFTISGVFFTFTGRMIFRYLIKNNKSLSTLKPPRRIIVLGAGEAAKLYVARLVNDAKSIDSVVFLDDNPEKHGTSIFGFPVEGRTQDVTIRAASFKADEICVLINNISKERLLELVQLAKKTSLPVKISSSHYNLMFTGIYHQKERTVETVPFITKDYQKLDLVYKRVIDFIGALMLGSIVAIPSLIIALMIKLSSKGPVLHSSFRVGKEGRLFKMYKFRSMKINNGMQHELMAAYRSRNGFHTGKVENDPRITKVGRFLRSYCLDELPQLINVLKGEMSLVGPRPYFNYELEGYSEWQFRRFLMKPGITGLWQVTGRQNETMLIDDALSTDVFYTDHFNIWMDFRILLKTIPVTLSGTSK
jgi:exopolysaccharide biosynthesis polyprenyl glycosylphosphotransferase